MNNKGVGAVFCFISALLMATRYVSAALFMSNVTSWGADLFQSGLSYVGLPLKIASIIALIAGIVFLGCGIYQDIKNVKRQ